ncbi:putative zinc-binding metallopeptidase [Paraliomyxa miuraensis]|uniref:putative zinc-binding metallopeptidase n=1 Tax=Paraliomyxa miuraensis TaxID=376150 RepID=UPI002258D1CE|nr:putative zinc-binding metallopeptidase [Paraliomyxa miuraensis]MCX4241625.1 putative zinc-binding metallopeptidase [Paraliomyxa miuraensis]
MPAPRNGGRSSTHGARRKAILGSARRSRSAAKAFPWEDLPADELLQVRLCDLKLRLEGTWLHVLVQRVQGELHAQGLVLRPHFWLSDEWASPDGIPGVAIPFYLAHPRLAALERAQMYEVEGGNRRECVRLLRHEVGHAMQHGYALHRRRRWQRLFGPSSQPYPDYYRPRPGSRRFVQHLEGWYAQSHPAEDFAETFAVWLAPRSNWRRQYEGWPALEKLEYVDELMNELRGVRPPVHSRGRPYSLPSLRQRLGEYYEEKRARYGRSTPGAYDQQLQVLFSADRGRNTAAAFLRKHRSELRALVARGTGQHPVTVDQVLKEMIARCQELRLRAAGSERTLLMEMVVLLTAHTVHRIHTSQWHAV